MPNAFRMHSASARIELIEGEVLLVTIAGPVTAKFLLALKSEIVDRNNTAFGAFVADYRLAAIAMTGADLDAVLEGESVADMPALPAALIAPSEQWQLWRGHCQRVAAFGITRRLFSDVNEGLTWARQESALGRWPLEARPG